MYSKYKYSTMLISVCILLLFKGQIFTKYINLTTCLTDQFQVYRVPSQ